MIDEAELRRHVGRKTRQEDVVTAFPVQALIATLGRDERAPAEGEPIPTGWHSLYFHATPRREAMTADGVIADGGLFPSLPEFPRRMFAGQSIKFRGDIRVGDRLVRESELIDIALKRGGTGAMIFVTARNRIHGPQGLCLEEEYSGVLREPAAPGAGNTAPRREAAPEDCPWQQTVELDVVTLFRFSALTFNAHRIHYDRVWATEVEGYPGLVVHGPLSLNLLLNFARDHMPGRRLSRFAMRARAPLFDTAPFSLVGRPGEDGQTAEVWAVTPEGTVAMSAAVDFA